MARVNQNLCSCINHNPRESNELRACADVNQKKNRFCLPYLPKEIILNILLCVPADILYSVMRYVCRDWYHKISSTEFIDAHLKRSDKGSFIKSNGYKFFVPFVNMEKGDPEMTKIHFTDIQGIAMSSCNGLILFFKRKLSNHYVANPVTNEIVTLPRPLHTKFVDVCRSGLGYTSSKKYKVVHSYTLDGQLNCDILTLGVDKEWRNLGSLNERFRIDEFQGELLYNNTLSSEGFLHWTHHDFVITLDLERETFFLHAVPECTRREDRRYFGTGRTLSSFDFKGKFSWEIWLLTDVETGDWTKFTTIDLGPHEEWLQSSICPRNSRLVPVGWLKDGEVAVLCISYNNWYEYQSWYDDETSPLRNCILYNVKTGAMNSFKREKGGFGPRQTFIPHVKSLVSLKFAGSNLHFCNVQLLKNGMAEGMAEGDGRRDV